MHANHSKSAVRPATDSVITIRDLSRTYPMGDTVVHALRGVNLDIVAW